MKRLAFILPLMGILILCFCQTAFASVAAPVKKQTASKELCSVRRVLDGTTLELSDNRIIRLAGVKMPADSKTAEIAKHFLEYNLGVLIEPMTNTVLLEFDEKNKAKKDGDGNNSIRAYVFSPAWNAGIGSGLVSGQLQYGGRTLQVVMGPKGLFINASLIRAGLGTADESSSYKYRQDFILFQKEARQEMAGIWDEDRERKLIAAIDALIKKYPASSFPLPMKSDLWSSLYGVFPEDYQVFLLRAGNLNLGDIKLARVTKDSGQLHIEKVWESVKARPYPSDEILFATDSNGTYRFNKKSFSVREVQYRDNNGKLIKKWADMSEWITDVLLKS